MMREAAPPLVCRWMIALTSVLVPSADRREWRDEWDGEIDYRWRQIAAAPERRGRAALLARCAGAFAHAAWLRKEDLRMESFLHDVRFALRLARREPAFTTVAVLTLALGIGAATALYTIVDGTLRRPLPFRDPHIWCSRGRHCARRRRREHACASDAVRRLAGAQPDG